MRLIIAALIAAFTLSLAPTITSIDGPATVLFPAVRLGLAYIPPALTYGPVVSTMVDAIDPLALLQASYTAQEMRAAGPVTIAVASSIAVISAVVLYVPSLYPECLNAPQCLLINQVWWDGPRAAIVDSNRVLIDHEWGHVLSARYRSQGPEGRWSEAYALIGEECLADSIATIVLARGGFSPNMTVDYINHYLCNEYWTTTVGAENVPAMQTLSSQLAQTVLNWAGR